MLAMQQSLSKRFYMLLSLPSTAMGFALSVQIAALSWILSTKYGFDIHEIGIVWAAGPLAGIIAQPIVGAISDNVWFWGGRRRPFIIVGGILAALMLLALPNIDIIGKALGQGGATIGIAIAVALTLDLSINVSFNPTRSIIADVTPEGESRTKGYTIMQTVSGVFGVMAYAIGALIDNYVLIYTGAALVLLFSVLPVFFISEPKELAQPEQEEKAKGKSFSFNEIAMSTLPLWGYLLYGVYVIIAKLAHLEFNGLYIEYLCVLITILGTAYVIWDGSKKESDDREFHKILIAHSFSWWGVQSMFVYMFAYIRYEMDGFAGVETLTDAQNNEIGFIISISFLVLNLVGALLPAFVLQPLTEKFGRVKVHTVCLFVMTLGYSLIYFMGQSSMMLFVLMAIVGIGWAAVISLPFAIMSERVNQAKMGLYMGIFNLAVVLPQLVASFKMGEVIGASEDKSVVFIICAVTLGISAVLWLFVRESNKVEGKSEQAVSGSHH